MYLAAKAHFNQLSNRGSVEASDLLDEYETILQEHGDFVAARFLRDVYIEFQHYSKEAQNG